MKWFVWLALLLAVVAGCNKKSYKTVGVGGTVYMDGQPLADMEIHFVSKNHAGSARTGPDGKYQLTQGAEPGENKVHFSKVQASGFQNDPESGMDAGQFEAMRLANATEGKKVEGQSLPADYSDPAKAQKYIVPDGGKQDTDFWLKSK